MNVLLLRGTPSPKRIRGAFLRHQPTRRTCFYAAITFGHRTAQRQAIAGLLGTAEVTALTGIGTAPGSRCNPNARPCRAGALAPAAKSATGGTTGWDGIRAINAAESGVADRGRLTAVAPQARHYVRGRAV